MTGVKHQGPGALLQVAVPPLGRHAASAACEPSATTAASESDTADYPNNQPVPSTPAQKPLATTYAGTAYWDKRYVERACNFDWFFTYKAMGELIRHVLGPVRDLPCLHVGCGNSTIQEGMAADGFVSVTNIDVSSVVIQQMQAQHDKNSKLHYKVCDCRDMDQFPDLMFGGVVDKGTLDAVACAQGGCTDVMNYLKEVDRVLRPGGVFLLVSLGSPMVRGPVVKGPPGSRWHTEVLLLPKPALYLASEASFSGRVLDTKGPRGSKDTPIDVMGPYTHEQAVQKLTEVHSLGLGTQQHDFFFAYVIRKANIVNTDVSKTDVCKADGDVLKADTPKMDVSKSPVAETDLSKVGAVETDVSKADISKLDVSDVSGSPFASEPSCYSAETSETLGDVPDGAVESSCL